MRIWTMIVDVDKASNSYTNQLQSSKATVALAPDLVGSGHHRGEIQVSLKNQGQLLH